MPSSGLNKSVCAYSCACTLLLITVSMFTRWRNIYSTPFGSVDHLNGTDQFFGLCSRTDKLVIYAGYLHSVGRLCDFPEGTGFVGDNAIDWLLSIAAAFYIHNISITVGLDSFPNVAYILPITCFIPTLLIASATIVFGVYYNDIEVTVDNNHTNVTLPNKITFANGFYLAISAMAFSFLTTLLSVPVAGARFNDTLEEDIQRIRAIRSPSVRSLI